MSKFIPVGLCLVACVISQSDEHFRTNNLTFVVEPKGIYRMLGHSQAENLTAGIISNIEKVQTLFLLDDSIREIQPGAFKNLPKLKHLMIQYNDISKIDAGIFNNLPTLTYLELGDNEISFINPHAFDNLTRLTSLRLKHNKLDKIDSHWFEDKPDLKYIHLAGNLIKKISADQFASLKGKKSMSVYLGHNPVETIEDDAFKEFEEMSLLCLNNITLTTITGTFLQNVQMEILGINGNKINCVNEEDFAKVFVAKKTEIKGNPLKADCLNKIQLWAQKHNKSVITEPKDFFLHCT